MMLANPLALVVALVVFGVALSGLFPLVAILSRDLQPLRGMPLQTLDISGTPVVSLDPLYGLPLRELVAAGFRKLPADLLLRCPALESVTVSDGTELSRKDVRWPAGVKRIVVGQ